MNKQLTPPVYEITVKDHLGSGGRVRISEKLPHSLHNYSGETLSKTFNNCESISQKAFISELVLCLFWGEPA